MYFVISFSLSIVLMIFVNSGGGGYSWIEHAAWNGLHLADIVFPSFLWIMGVCIPLSIKAQLGRGIGKGRICARIVWRAIKLFAIGLCLNSINGPQMEQLRLMGVLQRFGIAYLIVGVLHTLCSRRDQLSPQRAWQRAIYDVCLFSGELAVLLALVATYLGLTFGLPVPGCPRGYLGPGGKSDNAANPHCIGGAAGYVDMLVLGESHIYQHPTAKYVYDATAFDPEGVFGEGAAAKQLNSISFLLTPSLSVSFSFRLCSERGAGTAGRLRWRHTSGASYLAGAAQALVARRHLVGSVGRRLVWLLQGAGHYSGQQESMVPFLCFRHRRLGSGAALVALLHHRCAATVLRLSLRRVRHECHHHVCRPHGDAQDVAMALAHRCHEHALSAAARVRVEHTRLGGHRPLSGCQGILL